VSAAGVVVSSRELTRQLEEEATDLGAEGGRRSRATTLTWSHAPPHT